MRRDGKEQQRKALSRKGKAKQRFAMRAKAYQRNGLYCSGEELLRKETQGRGMVPYEKQWLGKVPSRSAKALKGKGDHGERKEGDDNGSEKEIEKS